MADESKEEIESKVTKVTSDDLKNATSSKSFTGLIIVVVLLALFGGMSLFANSGCTFLDSSSSKAAQVSSGATDAPSHKYTFRNSKRLKEHYQNHGVEMGYADAQAYLDGANAVINNPNSLHKQEAEDGDDVYYLVETDEIVFVSTDGYIRTYFKPGGIGYYNRQ